MNIFSFLDAPKPRNIGLSVHDKRMNVYFISCSSPDLPTVWIKIGKAKTPNDRLIGMQIGCPLTLRIVGTIPCKTEVQALWLEKELHKRLGWEHVRGEWFIAPEDYERKIQRIVEQETPGDKPKDESKKMPPTLQSLTNSEFAAGDSLWLDEEELAALTGKKHRAAQVAVLEGMQPPPLFHVRHHDQFALVQRWQFRT